MSHTPPREGTTGFTPVKKKHAKGDKDFVEDASEIMEDVSKKLFEEVKEEERCEHGAGEGSPGAMSTSSTSSEKGSLAEKLSNMANEMGEFAEFRKKEKEEKKKKEEEDIEKKEKECFEIRDELDGSDFASYDDPVKPSEGSRMSEETRRLYQEHLIHNIIAVCKAFEGNGNVPITKLEEQRGNYFSLHPRGIVIGHYPPSSQCGRKTNVAVAIHKSATKANEGKQIFRLKSSCIARQAHLIAQGMGHKDSFGVEDDGDCTYTFKYVACSTKPDRKGYARVIKSAAVFLDFDYMDRHPTFNDNKVNPEKLIDSKLGYQHRQTGDEKFAKVVKSRQADIAKANGNTMGSPKSTPPESPTSAPPGSPTSALPVMVWNAGRVKRDSERTGAQAALFQTLIKEIIEPLFGIHHPEYLMWTENPVVRTAAEETDLEICRFIEAFGGVVRVDDAFRKFVGVAECTPEELDRMARECSETMSALGMLAWISKGRPGSVKNDHYNRFFKKTEDETLSARLAQTQVMFDGALEAAARFAGLTADEVMELDEERVQDLIEAHRYDGLLHAAARFQNISWDKVEGMTKNEVDGMVRAYERAGQLTAAAKFFGISEQELEEMNEKGKDALIEKHRYAGQLTAAAKFFGTSEQELEEMNEKGKDALIENHIRDTSRAGQLTAAAKFFGTSEQELEEMNEKGKDALIEKHRYDGLLHAAARFRNISWDKVEGMTKNEVDGMVRAYERAGKLTAAAKFFGTSEQELEEMNEKGKDALIENHIRDTSRAGQLTAAAKFFGTSEQELEEMNEKGKDALIEKHRYDGLLHAAARFRNISWDKVEGMTKNEVDGMVRAYERAGKLTAAAKFFGTSEQELEEMNEKGKDALIEKHRYAGKLTAAAKFFGTSEQELEEMNEKGKDALIENHIRDTSRAGQLTSAAKFFGISEDKLEKMDEKIEAAAASKCIPQNVLHNVMTKKQLDDLIRDHIFDCTAEAAKSWAREQKVSDTSPFTSLPLVASTQQQQQSTAVERFLIKLSEGKFESLDKDTKNKLLKDLIAEYCYFSRLEKACKVFDENFDEAKGDTWTPQERRDIIERYNLQRRAESLGHAVEAVKDMTQEMRRVVKHTYNKSLLLSKLGIEADDGSHDDGDGDGDDTVDGKENLTYAEGMEMTIEEIQTLIVKLEGGGKTTQQAIRETFALALGLTEDRIKGLSSVDLDKIRVIRFQKGAQKKKIERGVFHLPGTSEHANVVKDICVSLRACGLRILSEAIENPERARFLNDWAFTILVKEEDTSPYNKYNVYKRVVFHGIEFYERVLDAVLCTGAERNWRGSSSTLTAITKYIYHKRKEFFRDAIGPDTLENLLAKNLNSKQLAERTKLQKKIEQNKDGLFKFAGDSFFDNFLEQLAIKYSAATFYHSLAKNKDTPPWWYKRVCVQSLFAGVISLYYQDDSGSWLGPTIQWDIVPGQKEKVKRTHGAIVTILNALDKRFPVASDGGEEENEEGV